MNNFQRFETFEQLKREKGFYWIVYGGSLSIGEWMGEDWYLIGDDVGRNDGELDEILEPVKR